MSHHDAVHGPVDSWEQGGKPKLSELGNFETRQPRSGLTYKQVGLPAAAGVAVFGINRGQERRLRARREVDDIVADVKCDAMRCDDASSC